MGAKPSKQEPVIMYVPLREGTRYYAVKPSPSTRLPPRLHSSTNWDGYSDTYWDHYSRTHWNRGVRPPWFRSGSRPPYLNREPILIEGALEGFHDDSRNSTTASASPSQVDSSSVSAGSAGSCATALASSIPEDELRLLQDYDTIFLVDDCSSMDGIFSSRWNQVCRVLSQLADLAGQYDKDGIDVYFLNNRAWGADLKDATSVNQVFSSLETNYWRCPVGSRLDELLKNYVGDVGQLGLQRGPKPLSVVILMKDSPSLSDEERNSTAAVIRRYAKLMDERHFPLTQVGLHFVQVSNHTFMKKYLKTLEDDLNTQGDIRDIVDITLGGELSAEGLLNIVLSGIKRRIEKQKLNDASLSRSE